MSPQDATQPTRPMPRQGPNTFATDLARAFGIAPTGCLASLVDGVIVASTRLTSPAGGVGWTEPFVRSPDFLALVGLAPLGRVTIRTGQKTHLARNATDRGGLILADLSVRPAFMLEGPFDIVAFLIPRTLLARSSGRRTFALPGRAPVHAPDAPDTALFHLAESLADGFAEPTGLSGPFIDSVLMAIAVHVAGHYADGRAPLRASGGMTENTLNRAMEKLRANLTSKATLGQIAAELGMSEGHFARTFKHSTGYSPHQWSMIQRCEQAKTLLREGNANLAQIATQTGFADQAHFSRSFRLIVGVTPRQWRDSVTGKPL